MRSNRRAWRSQVASYPVKSHRDSGHLWGGGMTGSWGRALAFGRFTVLETTPVLFVSPYLNVDFGGGCVCSVFWTTDFWCGRGSAVARRGLSPILFERIEKHRPCAWRRRARQALPRWARPSLPCSERATRRGLACFRDIPMSLKGRESMAPGGGLRRRRSHSINSVT
jgi:hypothetical protein